jgi:hypothetical protein
VISGAKISQHRDRIDVIHYDFGSELLELKGRVQL